MWEWSHHIRWYRKNVLHATQSWDFCDYPVVPTPMVSNRWTINPLSKFAQTELLWTPKINFLSLDCFVSHCASDNWIFSTIRDLVTSGYGFVVKFNGVILWCLACMCVYLPYLCGRNYTVIVNQFRDCWLRLYECAWNYYMNINM